MAEKNINKFHNALSDELWRVFGQKVYKLALDSGQTCPTRDGTKGTAGCFYCGETGAHYQSQNLDLAAQLAKGKRNISRRYKLKDNAKFLAYFQSYTPTYTTDLTKLQNQYEHVLRDPEIVGFSLCTRPDCLNLESIQLLARLILPKYHWLELGLQTSHNQTLSAIGRGHTYEEFLQTYYLAKDQGLRVCVHLILGLPGETEEMMLETVRKLVALGVDGLKFHQLHIVRNSVFAKWYEDGKIEVYDLPRYACLIGKILPLIPANIVIHRLIGDAPKDILIAPTWSAKKAKAIQIIEQYLDENNIKQLGYAQNLDTLQN